MSTDNARVLVVGDVAVGKTSLIRLLSSGKPVDNPPPPTVGCELEVLLYKYEPSPERELFNSGSIWETKMLGDSGRRDPKEYFIEFLEIGATHAHAVARRMFYHDYWGVILVYDLTSPRSCARMLDWRQELQSYTFERQDIAGDGTFMRIPEIVTGGEDRKVSQKKKLPVLVFATKTDQPAVIGLEHRFWVDKVLNEYSANEIQISTKRMSDLSPASESTAKLHAFYNKVIEAKFFNPSVTLPASPDMRSRNFHSKKSAVKN